MIVLTLIAVMAVAWLFLNRERVRRCLLEWGCNRFLEKQKRKGGKLLKNLIAFLRKNYTAREAAEAECHIGGIHFPVAGLRQFVCLADNVNLLPEAAVKRDLDSGPYNNVVVYKFELSGVNYYRLIIYGKIVDLSEVEDSESLLEEIKI